MKIKNLILALFLLLIFSASAFAQTLVSILPNSGNSGNTISAAITGQNTQFMNGSPMGINSIYFGNGSCVAVTATNINVVDDEHVNCDFLIPGSTGNGSYDIHVITNSLQHYLLSNGFTVTGGVTYGINAVSPDTVRENTTLTATIAGSNLQAFYASGNAQADLIFGNRIINGINLTVVNTDTLSAEFIVPSYAIDGYYDLKLTADAGCISLLQGVHVIASSSRALVAINPNTANAGNVLSAVITGQDLFFMTSTPQNGIGTIYLENNSCNRYYGTALNATDDDHLSADFNIPADATNGTYGLFATSNFISFYTLPNACVISGGTDRAIQSMTPGTATAGTFLQTTITGLGLDDILAGTNLRIWLAGPNLSIYDSTLTLISPTQLDVGFSIPIYSGNDFYDLHIESSKGCFKLLNAVQIQGGVFRGLISMQPSVAHRAEQLTAVLTGQYAYFMNSTSPSINFQESNGAFQYNVSFTNVTYIDTDHVSMTFTVPPAAPAGFYNVRAGLTALNDSLTLPLGFEITGYVASGRVFLDLDSNGVFDPGEVYLPGKRVRLLPDSIVTITDAQGYYYLPVDNGNYTIECIADSDWSVTSVPPVHSIIINNGDYYGLDFGIKPDHPYATSDLSISAGTPRCNTSVGYVLHYNFFTTASLTAYFTMIVDSNLSFISSSPTQSSISGDTVNWLFPVNPVVGSGLIYVNLLFPGTAGLDVISSVKMELKDGAGAVITSNLDTMRQVIRCSYDPNDKSVNPPGISNFNYTLNATPLQYQIRFQNTGNDTAINVHILDTIDAGLDLNTVQLLGSSHPVQILIHPNRVIDFRFDEIMLPDSGVDEPASHGYVLYRIRPESQLSDPYVVTNTAHIYFDFNLPVTTNSTMNTLVNEIPVGLPVINNNLSTLRLYPNPASDELYLGFDNSQHHRMLLQIYNNRGALITDQHVSGETGILNCKSFSPGLYMILLKDLQSGKIISGKFIKN